MLNYTLQQMIEQAEQKGACAEELDIIKSYSDLPTLLAQAPPKQISYWAYWWALNIGDRELMRDRVTDSKWAYWWANNIGDRELMRDRVTESIWAYWWARDIGDHEIMRDKVTESIWVQEWINNIGDKDGHH